MDNQRKDSQTPENENWLDDILGKHNVPKELGPDELAVAAAGLTHPDDMELEKIVQETLAEEWGMEDDAQQSFFDTDEPTQMFRSSNLPVEEAQPQQEIPEEEPQDEAPAADAKQPEEKKKGYGFWGIPHILSTVIWLALILVIGTWLGKFIWVCAADVLAFGKESKSITITIEEGDDIQAISDKMEQSGLIRYSQLFKLFAQLTGKDKNLVPGVYTLTPLDYNALANSMSGYGVQQDVVQLMIPEGYNCAQTFQLLEDKGICTVAELEEYAANGKLSDYWFLEGVKRGDKYCLEGYLFPDTYFFYENDEPRRVLEKFLDGFELRFTDLMKERLAQINVYFAGRLSANGYSIEYINSHQITIREVIIIASLIEKETASASESHKISSVIYNRLANQAAYPFLNIDAALVYALGGKIDPETGESIPLTEKDKQLDSPYNTYLYKGLIPGPISNPGQASINAALMPETTNYYYYALNPETGYHHFTTTYQEHLNFLNSI